MGEKVTKKIRYIILLLAVASCAYGIYTGEAQVMLKKAILICLECCGIG